MKCFVGTAPKSYASQIEQNQSDCRRKNFTMLSMPLRSMIKMFATDLIKLVKCNECKCN